MRKQLKVKVKNSPKDMPDPRLYTNFNVICLV